LLNFESTSCKSCNTRVRRHSSQVIVNTSNAGKDIKKAQKAEQATPTNSIRSLSANSFSNKTSNFISTSSTSTQTTNKANMIAPHTKKFRRNPIKRVFVNRSVAMNKIKAIGFDMDYTLAVYKSPQYEELGFKLIIEQVLKMGYPPEIQNYQYDPTFISRGLLFDNQHG